MATTMASLWPEVIRPGIQSPKILLDIQGKALNEQTRGFLTGAVTQEAISSGSSVFTELKFAIIAPALGYDYPVLTVLHAKDLAYPLLVQAEEFKPGCDAARQNLLQGKMKFDQVAEIGEFFVKTDEGLHKILGKIFSSSRVVAVAQSLIARVKEETKEEAGGEDKQETA